MHSEKKHIRLLVGSCVFLSLKNGKKMNKTLIIKNNNILNDNKKAVEVERKKKTENEII
jgi:hypothetical protein